MNPDSVISDDSAIDIVGARRDGGVVLVLVVSGHLGPSIAEQKLLRSRLQFYLDTIYSEDFQQEFGAPTAERTRILISCVVPPAPEVIDLVEQLSPFFLEQSVRLELQVKA